MKEIMKNISYPIEFQLITNYLNTPITVSQYLVALNKRTLIQL